MSSEFHSLLGSDWPAAYIRQGKSFWIRRGLTIAMLLTFILVAYLWLQPYVLSVYHTEVAGRLLNDCLVPVYPDRLAPERVVDVAGLQAAVGHLKEAIRLDPRNVQAMRLLARAYLSLGQPQAALEILQRALAIRPKNPLLHLEVADVYDALGYAEEARREYKRGGIGSRNAPLVANCLKLADAQMQGGSGEIAIHLWYETLILDPNNLYALYHLYKIHNELGDTKHAAIYLERLVSMNPKEVAVPLDFRLAEYQAQAMIALVKEKIWERERMLAIVSNQAQQSTDPLSRLITARLLEILLSQWPDDPDLLYLYQAISADTRGTYRDKGLML